MAAILFIVLALACIVYGVSIYMVGTGTLFFLVWFLLAAICIAAAWLVKSGIWHSLPGGLRLAVYLVAGLFVIALTVSTAFVISGMNSRDSERDDLDYLVVLGAQVHPFGPSTVLRFRLDTAYDYLADHPQTKVIVTGGQGFNEHAPEAEVMAEYLKNKGISDERIIVENTSQNTQENLENAASLVDGLKEAKIGIVTNNFHIYRSKLLAQTLGFTNVVGIPAPVTLWYLPNNVFREALALMKTTAQNILTGA